MRGFYTNITEATLANDNFRHVLYTGKHSQLVLMALQPGEEIGEEVHEENDQFIRVEEGEGRCLIDDNEYDLFDDSAVLIPAGAKHNVINTSQTYSLKLYTIYSPAHHQDGLIRATKEEAEEDEAPFDGKTSE
jgi:mannose-6-phosphate isomerase-like protein (cupin superfamily)